MAKEVIEFTIDRKKWARGAYADELAGNSLRRPNDKRQCCLGFFGRACGHKVSDLEGVDVPSAIPEEFSLFPEWLDYHEEDFFTDPNDSTMEFNTDAKREKEIIKQFRKHGVTVHFVGPRLPKYKGCEITYEEADELGITY